jgi:hypothetical protein
MPENFKVGKNLVLEIFRPKMAQNRPKWPSVDPKSGSKIFYCINGLRMAQFEKLSNKKIFEVKILKGWYPPDLENFAKIAKSKF